MIVDQHQPVVEKYYGPGRMRRVLKTLLQECDRVTKGIVDKWEEERSMKRKVNGFPVLSVNSPIGLFFIAVRCPGQPSYTHVFVH